MIQELEEIMGMLVSERHIDAALPPRITAEHFAENILGFEEVDENEGEDEDEGDKATGAKFGATASADASKLGVIQEEP
jgi:hypothetical protein